MSQPVWYLNVEQNPNAGNAYPLRGGPTTIEVILTNNSDRYIPDGWAPDFYSAQGQTPPTCIWYYDNTAVQPGEVIYVTFATHVESDDWVRAMVFDEIGYRVTVCFNAAAQVVSCQ